MFQKKFTPVTSSTFVVGEDHQYMVPVKMVKTMNDMQLWDKSEAYFEYMGFILAIDEAIKGRSNSQGSVGASEQSLKLVTLLDGFEALVDETPPIQQPQRFGNRAFRDFYKKVQERSGEMLQAVLPKSRFSAVPELIVYLTESFGNSTRIDYGTGHELSFAMFLCCMFKIGYLTPYDKTAVGCLVFPRYLQLVRKLQTQYRMEPAGSHGVWSLDDFQFIPFIWGSSQLIGHPKIEPHHFLELGVIQQYADDYMFLSCIQYINQVKTGPFAEHSNQLWNVSGVPSWSKINSGLIKMYKVEVLSKFPVVQHIVFGSLLPLTPAESSRNIRKAKMGMETSPVNSLGSQNSSQQVKSGISVTNPSHSECSLTLDDQDLNNLT